MKNYTNAVRVLRGKGKGAVGYTAGAAARQNPYVTHVWVWFPDRQKLVRKDRTTIEDMGAGDQLRLAV